MPWDADAHFSWFATLVAASAARVRIARDQAGEALGYDVVLPICDATLALARAHQVIAGTLDAYLRLDGAPTLAATPADTDLVFLAHLGLAGPLAKAARAALHRDFLSVLARGGVCLCSVDLDAHRQVARALGFTEVPGSQVRFRGAVYDGFALDLRGIGPELALRAVELAYLERTMSRERAAEELNVSRATFYRLLHRGVALLAAAFPEAAEG